MRGVRACRVSQSKLDDTQQSANLCQSVVTGEEQVRSR